MKKETILERIANKQCIHCKAPVTRFRACGDCRKRIQARVKEHSIAYEAETGKLPRSEQVAKRRKELKKNKKCRECGTPVRCIACSEEHNKRARDRNRKNLNEVSHEFRTQTRRSEAGRKAAIARWSK